MKARKVFAVCAALLVVTAFAGSALAWDPSAAMLEEVKTTSWEWKPHVAFGEQVYATPGVVLAETPMSTRPVGVNDGGDYTWEISRSKLTGTFNPGFDGDTVAIRGNK